MNSITAAGAAGVVALSKGLPPKPTDASKIQASATQFEALLIGQLLRMAHEDGSGWLGSGEDSSSSTASDFAEEQLANCMAQEGGFGLGKMIVQGLEQESAERAR